MKRTLVEMEVEMTRLMLILFSMISTTLMGIGVIAALTAGFDTLNPILIAACIGFVLAIPVSWYVARTLTEE
jgi:predicted PurR-regulated permease PerM